MKRQRSKHNLNRQVAMLSADEERDLVAAAHKGNARARERLIASHIPCALSYARRYRGMGAYEDICQEAMIGLVMAADRFNPERGVRFSTYVLLWVRASVLEFIFHNVSLVRRSKTKESRRGFWADLRSGVAFSDTSIHAPDGSDREDRLKSAAGAHVPDPEEQFADVQEKAYWEASLVVRLATLAPRERAIVKARWLKDDDKNVVSLAHLSFRLGISKQRVSQIEAGALKKLGAQCGPTYDGSNQAQPRARACA